MEKQSYSPKKSKKPANFEKEEDPCPVCDRDLFLNGEYTNRVGLLDDCEDVYGWMCPFCSSEFNLDGKPTQLFRNGKISGNA